MLIQRVNSKVSRMNFTSLQSTSLNAQPVKITLLNLILTHLECYNIDVTPCGTGLVYGGNGLGTMEVDSDSNIRDNGVIKDISKYCLFYLQISNFL